VLARLRRPTKSNGSVQLGKHAVRCAAA
jgi:hypothetical protein